MKMFRSDVRQSQKTRNFGHFWPSEATILTWAKIWLKYFGNLFSQTFERFVCFSLWPIGAEIDVFHPPPPKYLGGEKYGVPGVRVKPHSDYLFPIVPIWDTTGVRFQHDPSLAWALTIIYESYRQVKVCTGHCACLKTIGNHRFYVVWKMTSLYLLIVFVTLNQKSCESAVSIYKIDWGGGEPTEESPSTGPPDVPVKIP